MGKRSRSPSKSLYADKKRKGPLDPREEELLKMRLRNPSKPPETMTKREKEILEKHKKKASEKRRTIVLEDKELVDKFNTRLKKVKQIVQNRLKKLDTLKTNSTTLNKHKVDGLIARIEFNEAIIGDAIRTNGSASAIDDLINNFEKVTIKKIDEDIDGLMEKMEKMKMRFVSKPKSKRSKQKLNRVR